jgi:hypothetical protein
VADNDFRNGEAFRVTGRPTLSEDGAAVALGSVGQDLVCTPPAPVAAGRLGVNFEEQGRPAGARWTLAALFHNGGQSRRLVVTVAGAGDHFEVDAGGLAGVSRRVARSPGWHRLVLRFTPRSLRVTCDDDVLWYNLDEGPGGTLRRVILSCAKAPAEADTPRGAVAWAEFGLERAVDESPRPPADAEQDAVRLADGDELFGRVLRADRRAVEIEGRFGKRSLSWADVQGCSFRRETVPPRTTEGEHVRVRLRSGLCPEADELEGVVTGLDERRLTLRHALLGDLAIERARLQELRPLFHGKRIELDAGPHHLGPRGQVLPGLRPAHAEGLSWRGSFRLDAVPAEARLVVHVLGLSGAGGARTEVVVNGRRVDYLNRQVDRAESGPRRLAVPLPRDALRSGDNAVELLQTADPSSGRPGHCVVSGLALEIPR